MADRIAMAWHLGPFTVVFIVERMAAFPFSDSAFH
jgi:hypothetical protein